MQALGKVAGFLFMRCLLILEMMSGLPLYLYYKEIFIISNQVSFFTAAGKSRYAEPNRLSQITESMVFKKVLEMRRISYGI